LFKNRLLVWAKNIIYLVLVVASVFFIILMVHQEKIAGDTPGFGRYKLMIVMSGSMKPAFDTGSLIVVKKINPEMLHPGDIITYRYGENEGRFITHRIMEVVQKQEGIFFVTKGDANDTRDFFMVPEANVMGKVAVALPYLGYIVGFPWFKTGVLVFLIISISLALIGEFRAIHQMIGRVEN
jgi:signal peptidase